MLLRVARIPPMLLLLIAGCQSTPVAVTPELEPVSASAAVQTSAAPAVLPPSCILFLSQLRCWLAKSGNEPEQVALAVGAARAIFESGAAGATPDDPGVRCDRAMAFRREALETAGCEEVVADAKLLPPADAVTCGPDEHFFIRRDGHVAGCHPDCATARDCPAGHHCWSIGSAPGGPIDEPFCE